MLTLAAPTLLFLTCGDDMVNTCHITLQIRENNALKSTTICTDDPCWHLAESRVGCLFIPFIRRTYSFQLWRL